MAYPLGGTILRSDIRTALEQGSDVLKFCIAEKIAPVYESEVKAGQYLRRNLEDKGQMRLDNNYRAPGASYPEVTSSWRSDTFECVDYGYKSKVDDSLKAYADRFFDLEVSTATLLDQKLMLAYELRVQSQLYATANFTTTSAYTAYTQANLTTTDFVHDVQAACERQRQVGTIANTIVLSFPLWNFVRRTTLFQNYVRGNFPTVLPTILTPEQAAKAFFDQGIEQMFIGGAYQDIGGEGLAFSGSQIWQNTYFWVGKVESGDFMKGGAMRTIAWSGDGGFKAVESYRAEDFRSDFLRVRQNVVEKVIDSRAGQLIQTSADSTIT
jgi:hypothetical protein